MFSAGIPSLKEPESAPCFYSVMDHEAQAAACACILAFGPANGTLRDTRGIRRANFRTPVLEQSGVKLTGPTYQYVKKPFGISLHLYDHFAIFETNDVVIFAFRGTDFYDSNRLLGRPLRSTKGSDEEALVAVASWTDMMKACAKREDVGPLSDCNADHFIAMRSELTSPLHNACKTAFEAFTARENRRVVVAGASLGASIASYVARPNDKVYLYSPAGTMGPKPSWVQSTKIQSYREVHDIVSMSTTSWFPTITATMKASDSTKRLQYHGLQTFLCDPIYKSLTGRNPEEKLQKEVISLKISNS
jgi:hypothetical protein